MRESNPGHAAAPYLLMGTGPLTAPDLVQARAAGEGVTCDMGLRPTWEDPSIA